MSTLDILQVVLIGFGSGFGSAFGVEFARVVFTKLKGVKLVKEVET